MEFLQSVLEVLMHLDGHLVVWATEYGFWIYLLLFVVVFCETGLVITPFLPGDSLLFAAGVSAGHGLLKLSLVFLTLAAAGILGDACNFLIGRAIGPVIFRRETRLIKKKYLLEAHAFYERHGGLAIVMARFIPILRTFAPFVAGIALMQPKLFLLFNITGCLLWVGGLVSAGYLLGHLPWVAEHFSLIVYLIVALSLLPLLVSLFRHGQHRGS
ncbi:MAG: VTT domain-containing protein [Desulfovibrio sp.]|nr:VTT domain-containing protein [Desulfovibrio sp.]